MSYIGRDIRTGAFRQLDDISSGFDGSDTTHTMQVNSTNVSVGDVNQILLSLGGVIQKPGTDFTVSGSTLTFTTAPAANTNFFAILLGSDNGGTVTPTDNSVTASKISSNLGGDIVFNEDSNDHNFRIEGDGDANAFFLDAGVDRVYLGNNANTSLNDCDARLQISGTDFDKAALSLTRYSDNANGATLVFGKSRNATLNGNTIVQDNDELGKIRFCGADGTDFGNTAVEISAFCNGTPGSNDMPGGLKFSTAADGGTGVTERMRIHTGGVVSIPGGVELGSALDATPANTLDDYEEGTFDVVVADATSGGNSNDMTATGDADGVYTKIGDMVYWSIAGTIDTSGLTGTNVLYLRGLPFAANNKTNFYEGMTPRMASNYINFVGSGTYTQAHTTIAAAATWVQFYQSGDASNVPGITVSQFTDDTNIRVQGMYHTDS